MKVFSVESAKITHVHPVRGLYSHERNGLVSFMNSGISDHPILKDVKGYELLFHGDDPHGYEKWALEYRLTALDNMASEEKIWYLGFDFFLNDEIYEELVVPNNLEYTFVSCDIGHKVYQRLIFSLPASLKDPKVKKFWKKQLPGYTIEGYLMEPGRINDFSIWDKRPRDAQLLRQVLDKVLYLFYTTPAENRDFVFLTMKFSFEEFKNTIGFDLLRRKVNQLNKNTGNQSTRV